jgi:uncharacterized protein YeaO (DUF488 family)
MVNTKRVYRVYKEADPHDGAWFLVERLWPRGRKEAALPMDGWSKATAPRSALRQEFGPDPQRWAAFTRRYFAELQRAPDAGEPLPATAWGARSRCSLAPATKHNNAVALPEYLARALITRA